MADRKEVQVAAWMSSKDKALVIAAAAKADRTLSAFAARAILAEAKRVLNPRKGGS